MSPPWRSSGHRVAVAQPLRPFVGLFFQENELDKMLEKLEDAGGLKGPKRFSFFRCGWSPVLVSCLVVLWVVLLAVACCCLRL